VSRPRLSRLLLAAVIAAAVVGCGGDGGRLSKGEYEERMQEIGTELRNASSGLDFSQTSDLQRLADTIAEFRDRIEEAANEVDDLNPPEDAETETQQIGDTLHAFAETFDKMEESAREGKLQELQAAQQELTAEGAEAERATESLKEKGYNIGDLGG
jgi:soluble cytochrome b562